MIEDKSQQAQTTLRSWVENIKSTFNSKKDSTLQIYFGGNKIYDQVGNKPPQVDRLEDALGRKFQQALESSAPLKNAVRILSDGMKVYHALRGDKLDAQYSLSSVPKQNLDQVQDTPKESVSQDLHSWVENLKSTFSNSESPGVEIYFNNETIYLQLDNKAPTIDRLGDDIGKSFQEVLESSSPLKDSISIYVTGAESYHAFPGDKLDAQYSLSSVLKPSLDQVQDTPKETISPNPVKQESTTPWNDIRSLISEQKQNPEGLENAIFQLLVDQATRINQLEQKVEAMSQNKPLNANFGKWFGELQQNGEEALQELKGRAQQVPQGILRALGNTKNKIQENVKKRLADVAGNTLNAGTRYLAERFGQDDGNGVKVFQGNSLTITASAQHSGIYNKNGQKLVQDGQIISPVTSDQLTKIAQVSVEAQNLKQGKKQVATKALRV